MSLYSEVDNDNDFEENSFSDCSSDEKEEAASHKRQVRKMLEEKLERKRLKEEFDELDGEFDWDEYNR